MIVFDRVSKGFATPGGRKQIMRDVSLALPRGRSVGLLGRNGSGKTTMLRMIGGSVEPDAGVIRREGRVSWPLGFSGGFHGSLTGVQNARFIARIYGVDTDEMVRFVADFSELGAFMEMPVKTYSSGMKSRLAFATSMAVDFDVYLVDEITAVGDSAFKKKCREAFRARSRQADIIMVSHATETLREYCTHGVVLEGGRVEAFEDIDAAIRLHEANMRRAPGGP